MLFGHTHDVASKIGDAAIYKEFGDVYKLFGIAGLGIASGISLIVLFWERRPTRMRIAIIYWIFLALILPLSVLNYWSGDIFVSRWKQAIVDVVLAFLGLVAVGHLIQLHLTSIPSRVLQAFAIFFLMFQAVFLPLIYSLIWFLNWQRAIDAASTKSWNPGWISVVVAIGSLIVSVLNYRHTTRKPDEEKRIVLR